MARNGIVDWYGDDVLLQVRDATADGLLAAAFQVEAQAKVNVVANGQVDTGFMLNAIYAAGIDESDYAQARGEAEAQNPDASMAAEERPPDDLTVLVAAAAEYAIYQEITNSFLYRALEQVAPQVGGHVETAAGEHGLQ